MSAQINLSNNLHPPEMFDWLLPNFLYFLITYKMIIVHLIDWVTCMFTRITVTVFFIFFPEMFVHLLTYYNFKGLQRFMT